MALRYGSKIVKELRLGGSPILGLYLGDKLILGKTEELPPAPPVEGNYIADSEITMIPESSSYITIQNTGAYSRQVNVSSSAPRYTYVKVFTKLLEPGRYKFSASLSDAKRMLGFQTQPDLYDNPVSFTVETASKVTLYLGLERGCAGTVSNMLLERTGDSLPPRPPFKAPNIENVREVYTNKDDGREKTIIWTKGIKNPPKMGGANPDFRYANANGYITYDVGYTPNQGWYDANKDERTGDDSLCFMAASTNSLYWWLDINKDYIQRFFDEGGKVPKDPQGTRLAKLKEIINSPRPQYRSTLWEYFYHNEFGGRDKGGYSDCVIDQFLNGYWIDNPRTTDVFPLNSEENQGQRILDEGVDPNGGFFNEVLNIRKLTQRKTYDGKNLEDYTRTIRETIENGGIVCPSLYYALFGNAAHVITMWGAEFNNDDGSLSAIYVSDSDDVQHDETFGMERRMISTKDGVIKMTTKADGTGGSMVYELNTLMAGTELWEDYFIRKGAVINGKS